MVRKPWEYDIVVTENMFGDIVSDLCAQMVGGLGFGCSGNIGAKLAVFEPTHGSAPKYAGQYKVNPIATILAAKMMLEWLGAKHGDERLTANAASLERAVRAVFAEGDIRPFDLGGNDGTQAITKAVMERIAEGSIVNGAHFGNVQMIVPRSSHRAQPHR
jgi:isocitrate/isopropylmalate dehydrogenase